MAAQPVQYVKVYPSGRVWSSYNGSLAYYPVTSVVVVDGKVILRGYWDGPRRRQKSFPLKDYSFEVFPETWEGPFSGNGVARS